MIMKDAKLKAAVLWALFFVKLRSSASFVAGPGNNLDSGFLNISIKYNNVMGCNSSSS
jgi:hypothetical protein